MRVCGRVGVEHDDLLRTASWSRPRTRCPSPTWICAMHLRRQCHTATKVLSIIEHTASPSIHLLKKCKTAQSHHFALRLSLRATMLSEAIGASQISIGGARGVPLHQTAGSSPRMRPRQARIRLSAYCLHAIVLLAYVAGAVHRSCLATTATFSYSLDQIVTVSGVDRKHIGKVARAFY